MTPSASEHSRARGKGDDQRASPPPPRSLADRLDDPNEPLYTVAVAAELLDTDNQTLRRLGQALDRESARPSGNQRRYTRRDLESLEAALRLARDGHPPQSISRIIDLERRIADGSPSDGTGAPTRRRP